MDNELKQYLEVKVAEDNFSGVVLVAKNEKIIFEYTAGLANRELKIPNNIETKFNLGSMNKMFTAVGIAQLVESGKLSFQDHVEK